MRCKAKGKIKLKNKRKQAKHTMDSDQQKAYYKVNMKKKLFSHKTVQTHQDAHISRLVYINICTYACMHTCTHMCAKKFTFYVSN